MSFLLSSLLHLASAQTPHTVVPEDMFTLDEVRGLAASQSGTRLVYARARWDEAMDAQRVDLWTVEVASKATARLTFDHPTASAPRFGPLGAHVYFLAKDASGKQQVHRVPASGGAVMALTAEKEGVAQYRLDAQGGVWFSTCKEEQVEDGWKAQRTAWPDLSYADRAVSRCTVRKLDLASWRTSEVWRPDAHIGQFDVTPDGARLAAVLTPDSELVWNEGWSTVKLFEVATGALTALPDAAWRAEAPSPYGWIEALAWSTDGRVLAVGVDFDGYPGETYVAELAGGEARLWKVPRPAGLQAMGGELQWVPGERELCQRMADHGRVRVLCTPKLRAGTVGKPEIFPRGDVVVNTFSFSGDGRDAFAVVGTPTTFPSVYRLPARGSLLPVRLLDPNPHTADWQLPTVEVVTWKAPDGTTVEGVLEKPPGYTPEQGPLPLLVVIHGGPTAMDTVQRSFSYGGRTAFSAKGWAVLSPNYRGSLGYGDAFTTGLVGQENAVEVADILSGVDHLVSTGVADPERLGVMGWSNGGYLVNALIAATPRFKGAVSGAGVIDQALQWATEDTPGHVINFMQGQPWQKPEAYVAASPLYRLAGVTTPTLIHVGANDERVPPQHAEALFRALHVYLDVPVELVVYPDTGHGLSKLSQRKAKVAWDHAWLDRYVLGKVP